MSALTPLVPPRLKTIHQQVIQTLGLQIVSGALASDAILPPEPVLCAQIGVSRGALREAVKALAAKGLLELRPRTGTRVLPRERWNVLDTDVLLWLKEGDRGRLITELTEVRGLIEPGAARFAAERATEGEKQQLLDAYERMARASTRGDLESFTRADVEFHHVLLRISHNSLLGALNQPLSVALQASFETTSTAEGAVADTLPLHRDVARAIASGDSAEADARMQQLIAVSVSHFQRVRDDSPSKGL
ncbi:FadR/GntR family transcriptional regulator [Herbiconiux sp. UC225_62]|uniref:FadR/GntR family transcriptional regulator n=1 Tax=Herbiconiux sp. UC225_62 TaxID=3350168 RepID=UPI0036D2F30C